jgi:hypothetical protein
MKHHEREFFISRIRSGKTNIIIDNNKIIIISPTIDILQESCEIFDEIYEKSYNDGIMTEEDNENWMIESQLWSKEEEEKIKGYNKDLERLKVEIYNAKNNDALKEKIRLYLRSGEKQLLELQNKKNQYYLNTCEGIATSEKTAFIIKNTSFIKNNLCDFEKINLTFLIDRYHNTFLKENEIRELARTEPWKSLWIIRQNSGNKLFCNPENTDLNYNQKNLIIWSQMYDNIQESLDCPSKEVIEDDDMLDGWFIIQSKKRDKEKSEQDFENSVKSNKIKNSSEIFIMAPSQKEKERIDNMNDVHGNIIKKQRFAVIEKQGKAEQQHFQDEKLRISAQQNEAFKNKFRR